MAFSSDDDKAVKTAMLSDGEVEISNDY